MSKINELLEQFCPKGVEFKELGMVMTITRGASPRPIQNFTTKEPEGIPWIKIGDVESKSKFITNTKEKITKLGANKSRFLINTFSVTNQGNPVGRLPGIARGSAGAKR